MPTYEYACTSCSHHIEVVQTFTDDPLELCSACGGRLRRVFHPAGILFKGSGFYSTDKNHHYRETTKPKLADKPRDRAGEGKGQKAAGPASGDSGSGAGSASGSSEPASKAVEKSA
jgi:putative FmdB family regulatory protein